MENNFPSYQRAAVESIIARRISPAWARFDAIRLDSYRSHREKIPWHSRIATANKTQLARLTLLAKKPATVVHLPELALTAAIPKETMISPISDTRRA